MALADLIKSSKAKKTAEHEDLLSYQLHKHLCETERKWRMGGIHASDVTKDDFCARLYALHDLTTVAPQTQQLYTTDKLVYKQGNMHATMIRQWAADAGLAVGDWRCLSCGLLHELCKRPKLCINKGCKCRAFAYVEIRVKSTTSGIGCGLDLLLKLPGREKLLLYELKSYDKDKFQALKMPLAEHRLRTNLYLRCVGESDSPLRELLEPDEARVFYVTKGGWGEKSDLPKQWGLPDRGWTPFKEFSIKRDDQWTEESVHKATPLYRFREHEGPIPAGICPSIVSSQAQACPVRDVCFGGKYPAGAE